MIVNVEIYKNDKGIITKVENPYKYYSYAIYLDGKLIKNGSNIDKDTLTRIKKVFKCEKYKRLVTNYDIPLYFEYRKELFLKELSAICEKYKVYQEPDDPYCAIDIMDNGAVSDLSFEMEI